MKEVLQWICIALLAPLVLFADKAGGRPRLAEKTDAAAPGLHKNVLLVLSYNESRSTAFCVPFLRKLNESPFDCSLSILSINSQNGTKPEEDAELVKGFLPDIQAKKFDAIVALNNPAYSAVQSIQEKIPAEIPILFSRLRIFTGIEAAHTNKTGNHIAFEPEKCADLARQLFPRRRHAILITDRTVGGSSVEKRVRKYAQDGNLALTVFDSGYETISEVLAGIEKDSANSFIMYYAWDLAPLHRPDLDDSMLASLIMRSDIPVFRLINLEAPQYGVVGGVVASSRTESAGITVQQLLKIFNGEKAASIPVVTMPAKMIVNYGMLEHYHIPESNVPQGTQFLGKKETVWSAHENEILAIFVSLLLLALAMLAVSFSFVLVVRRNYRIGIILRKVPLRCTVVDEQERVLYNIFSDEDAARYVKGHPIKMLEDFPADCRNLFRECIQKVFATGQAVYADYTLFGHKRSVLFSAIPESVFHRRTVVWFSQDTTELQNTRNQYKQLLVENQRNLDALKHSDYENRMTLDNVQIPIWLYDAKGSLLYVNRAVCIAAGMDSKALMSLPDRQVFYKALPSNEALPIEQVIASGKPVRREVVYHNRNYVIHADPIFNAGHQLLSVVKSAVDVTDLNEVIRNEKVLNSCFELLMAEKESGNPLAAVLGIVCRHMKADHCFVVRFNVKEKKGKVEAEFIADGGEPAAPTGNLLEIDPDSIWFKNLERNQIGFSEDIDAGHERSALEAWQTHLEKFEIKAIFSAGIFVGGKLWGNLVLCYHAPIAAFPDHDIMFLKSVGHVCELLIERNEARQQVLDALHQAQAADKAKSFFVASVSHELRTPLNSVIGFSELLLDDSLSRETQKDYIRSIAYSGNALLQLINDVLDLSKLESGQMLFTPAETDVGSLIHKVGMIFKQKCDASGLYIRYDMPSLPLVYIDQSRFRQILFNLIGNAVKFTSRGGITIKAGFSTSAAQKGAGASSLPIGYGELTVRVEDTGVGISQDDQKRLFQPFVQSHAMRGTYAANNGTGLGLALVRRMLDRMNGSIALESELGKGTCFIISFKHLAFSDSAILQGKASGNPPDSFTQVAGGMPLRGFSLLLVDDVPMNLKVLEAIVKKLGGTVITATNGREALEFMETARIDLVLTDQWMPEMNGSELAGIIRSSPLWKDIPIVAVTADVERDATFDTTWFTTILTKPVTVDKILGLLAVIEQRRQETGKGEEQ